MANIYERNDQMNEAIKQAKDSGMPNLNEYIKELRTAVYRGL